MKQAMLFGEELRDIALERVAQPSANNYDTCLAWSKQYVTNLPSGERFISYELITKSNIDVREPRVWGAVLNTLVREGYIIATPNFIKYPGASRHAAPCRVWIKR